MKITRQLLYIWDACYTEWRIQELVPPGGLTPLEIAELDIPVADRVWVLLHEEVLPARELRLLACKWAEEACRNAGVYDERNLNAIAVARRYAIGEATDEDLNEALLGVNVGSYPTLASSNAAWAVTGVVQPDITTAAVRAAWGSAKSAVMLVPSLPRTDPVNVAVTAGIASVYAAGDAARLSQLNDIIATLKQLEDPNEDNT